MFEAVVCPKKNRRSGFCLPVILLLSSSIVVSCIHPKVGIRKTHLLDPIMDPAQSGSFSDSMGGSLHGNFEKAVVSGEGASGGSCPTCK